MFLQDASKKFSTKYANAEFECRRNYIQADILIARGAYLPAIKILERNLQLADKYELAAEKTLTQQLARTMTHRIKRKKTGRIQYKYPEKPGIDDRIKPNGGNNSLFQLSSTV
ncbi:MAG: hypothetical protein IPH89_15925 [Bacteroidetes bacterium]|nr:hypothetical protein [Bacteroidota bacterium]